MIHRIITYFFSLVDDIKWKSYYKTCIKRGLYLDSNVTLHNEINFGSEPFLIKIGKNSRISSQVNFITHSGGQHIMRKVAGCEDIRIFGRIKIGENTFIGTRTIITNGVKIGNNCIIAAGSIVTSSIPNNSVFGGVPAKFICTIDQILRKEKKRKCKIPKRIRI